MEEVAGTVASRSQEAVVAGGDILTVRGTFEKAYGCYDLAADALTARERLVLRVAAHESGRCRPTRPGVTVHSDYLARVAGLDPGRYAVTVLHEPCCSVRPPDTLVHRQVIQIR